MTSPFHPESLDADTLRRLAKSLKKGFPDVLPGMPITLSQAQELLARTLRYPDWHHAIHARAPAIKAFSPSSNDPQLFEPHGVKLLLSMWDTAALRSMMFSFLLFGLQSNVRLLDQLSELAAALETLNEHTLSALVKKEVKHLATNPDAIIWWQHVAQTIAPMSDKVALLIRIMAHSNDWSRGGKAIQQQCALEQNQGSYRDAQTSRLTASDTSPWRFVANRHMVLQALSACLEQGMRAVDALRYLRDDFRDNGHMGLSQELERWLTAMEQGAAWNDWMVGLAQAISPYSLETALFILVGPHWESIQGALVRAEQQSLLELIQQTRTLSSLPSTE